MIYGRTQGPYSLAVVVVAVVADVVLSVVDVVVLAVVVVVAAAAVVCKAETEERAVVMLACPDSVFRPVFNGCVVRGVFSVELPADGNPEVSCFLLSSAETV